MASLGILAVLIAVGCSACAFLLSRLHRRHRAKQQPTIAVAPNSAINNQRHFCTLIRNVEPDGAPLAPGETQNQTRAPTQPEEIELILPPGNKTDSPRIIKSSPKVTAKIDICNREREKLNRFHCAEQQEQEA